MRSRTPSSLNVLTSDASSFAAFDGIWASASLLHVSRRSLAANVVIAGPSTEAQMEDNLAALAAGPLDEEEMARIRRIGRHIYGRR